MADGFGFRVDTADAVEAGGLEAGRPAPEAQIQAGTGAGEPESWWGELVEFAAPFLAMAGIAAVIVFAVPAGADLFMAGWRT
jgi:hypothetical protein